MKTNYIKKSLVLMALITTSLAVKAQTSVQEKSSEDARHYTNIQETTTKDGKHVDKIETNWDDKYYKMELVNDKMVSLSVDGEKIPPADWGKYSDAVTEIKARVKRDKEQAKRDQEQASRDQVQAKKDQEQAGRDREQAKRDQEQASQNQIQAKKDEEQAARDQEQAKRDQEQAERDQTQAKHDQEEAAEDQRLLKQMFGDLITDKIVPDEKSIHDITLNAEGMTVNGVKQPDQVYQKYKTKYARFALGNFTFGAEDGGHGMHMSRTD